MKSYLSYLLLLVMPVSFAARGQGTFIYDQQSSTNETPMIFGEGGVIQQAPPPWGQSFTPSLTAIDFLRLKLSDNNPTNGIGATLRVNLLANSINGIIVASSISVTLTNGFSGTVNFLLSNTVTLTIGVTYYFAPVVQSGDLWNIDVGPYNYPGGTTWGNGLPGSASDLWFREGIIAPEPSPALLVLFGVGVGAWRHRKKHRIG